MTVPHSIHLGRKSDPGVCRAAEFNLRSNLTTKVQMSGIPLLFLCQIYMYYISSETYLRALPDGGTYKFLFDLCSVQIARLPTNQKTKTGVEPTILPIVMLFTLCLLHCVYSDMKDNVSI